MVTLDPKTLHDSINPLVYANCLFGMGTVRQPNRNKATYRIMMIHTVLFTLNNWIMIFITLYSIGDIIAFANTSPLALMMYRALVTVNSCITVIAPFLLWLRTKILQDCLRQMVILDCTFQTVFGVRNEYRKQYIRLSCQIMATLLVMFLIGIFDTISSLEVPLNMEDIQSVLWFASIAHTLHHPILVMLVLDLNFCFFVRYLEKKFRDMNESLLELTEKPPALSSGERLFIISRKIVKTSPKNIANTTESEELVNDRHYLLREIRKAYSELCKLSRNVNIAFGIQNLLSMGISFVMITGLLYTIYSAFSWEDFTIGKLKEIIPSAVWTAIYSFKIWMVNHSCWSVSTEADRTGEVIYELLNSRVDEELQREIQEFGVQMLKNPIEFNACGFFTLDYTFVQGAIGSITTYLVILIQMSHAYNIPISNTTLAWNMTENSNIL